MATFSKISEGTTVMDDDVSSIELGVATTTSGSTSTITGIPAEVKTLILVLNKVSVTAVSAEIQILLGDSGGIETSGYVGTQHLADGTTWTSQVSDTAYWLLAVSGGGADPFCTVINLARSASGANDWIYTATTKQSTAANNFSTGSKSLSGELTQIQLKTTGTFDAGDWNAYYTL